MNLTAIPTTKNIRRSGRATRSSLLAEEVEITKVRSSESSTSELSTESRNQDSETTSNTASQLYPLRSRGSTSSLRKRVHAQNGNIQKPAVPADPVLEKVKSNSAKAAAAAAARRYPGSRQSQRLASSWSTTPGLYNNPWREVSPAPRSTSHHEGSHLGTRTMKSEEGKVPTFCHHKYEDRKHRMMLDFLDRD